MHLRVAWDTESGTERGDLTQDELPSSCDRKIPLVISDEGRAMTPGDLDKFVLHVAGPETDESTSLIRAAIGAGYKILPLNRPLCP